MHKLKRLAAAAIAALFVTVCVVSTVAFGIELANAQSVVSASVSPPAGPVVEIVQCPATPAADTTKTCAPAGDWVGDLALALPSFLATVIMGVILRFLPAQLKAMLDAKRTQQAEQLLERALGMGASKLANVLKGKGISVDVRNHFLATGLQYAIDHGASKLLQWMGGNDGILQKLEARLVTSPAVAAVTKPQPPITAPAV